MKTLTERRAISREPATGFSDPQFARIAQLAHLHAGLVFPANRQPGAEAGMRRAMASLRISDPAALYSAVQRPGEARDVVFAELTVGESYFFRDAAQLEILASEVLPSRVSTRGAERPLNVWSAGCASGEEPYTLAILLRESGWPHPAKILATDLALPRLAAARRGRYTRWALRGVSEPRIERWFRRNGTSFDVEGDVRASVEFEPLNLVSDIYPGGASGGSGFDLILCRNVMIYFDLPTVASIAERLLDALDEDGWLVLGASDPPLAHLVECTSVLTSAGVAYRRAGASGTVPRSIVPAQRVVSWYDEVQPLADLRPRPVAQVEARNEYAAPVPERVPPTAPIEVRQHVFRDIELAYQHADYPGVERMALVLLVNLDAQPVQHALWVLYIRAVANQGRLIEAGELCTRALELHTLSPELHYLHAMLLAEAGWHLDAAAAARRAIYLDRHFAMAHLALGDALYRAGDERGARLAFENVLAALADSPPGASAIAADGVPVSRLRQIASARLASDLGDGK
ncbi:MAG: protein-glutamate O-methyltransferase CheR [Gemmatimonadota bacterium]